MKSTSSTTASMTNPLGAPPACGDLEGVSNIVSSSAPASLQPSKAGATLDRSYSLPALRTRAAKIKPVQRRVERALCCRTEGSGEAYPHYVEMDINPRHLKETRLDSRGVEVWSSANKNVPRGQGGGLAEASSLQVRHGAHLFDHCREACKAQVCDYQF